MHKTVQHINMSLYDPIAIWVKHFLRNLSILTKLSQITVVLHFANLYIITMNQLASEYDSKLYHKHIALFGKKIVKTL